MDNVTLKCTKCRRRVRTPREDSDPVNATRIETLCDRCDDGGNFPQVFYFDGENREINCDGELMSEA